MLGVDDESFDQKHINVMKDSAYQRKIENVKTYKRLMYYLINPQPMSEYVYLLREREFVRIGENTYKIGRSAQPGDNRFARYPKGSQIEHRLCVPDSKRAERAIKTMFEKYFVQKTEYGSEYFEGKKFAMVYLMNTTIGELKLVPSDPLPTAAVYLDIKTLDDPANKPIDDNARLVQPKPKKQKKVVVVPPVVVPPVVTVPIVDVPVLVPPVNTKKYQCDMCGKVFKDRSNLYAHKNNKKTPCVASGKDIETFASLKTSNNELKRFMKELEEKNVALEKLVYTQSLLLPK